MALRALGGTDLRPVNFAAQTHDTSNESVPMRLDISKELDARSKILDGARSVCRTALGR